MEWSGKMIVPVRSIWFRVAKRLRIRKTGLVKLRHDVRTCEYEDVQVLWEMLKINETEVMTTSAAERKKGHLWRIVNWARCTPFLCRHV